MDKDEAQKVAEATVKRMTEKKPKWFEYHEASDLHEFGSIRETLKHQDAVLSELKIAQLGLIKIQEEYHEKTIPVFEYLNEITVGKKIQSDYLKATGMWIGIAIGLSSVGGLLWAFFKFLVFNAK